jgi:hypothetical protein
MLSLKDHAFLGMFSKVSMPCGWLLEDDRSMFYHGRLADDPDFLLRVTMLAYSPRQVSQPPIVLRLQFI